MWEVDLPVSWSLTGLAVAFVGGLVSFLSPCVLPLVPGYLSYISGVSMEEMRRGTRRSRVLGRVCLNSFFFILGFTTVFVALGATATALSQTLDEHRLLLTRISGVVVAVLGLHVAGVFRIGFLSYEKRLSQGSKRLGFLGSFLVGFAFAFGWVPCVGPILAAIVAFAAAQETIREGIVLLVVYSLGLGVPFFLAGLALNTFFGLFERIKDHFRWIEIISGALLVGLGVMLYMDSLTMIIDYYYSLQAWLASHPRVELLIRGVLGALALVVVALITMKIYRAASSRSGQPAGEDEG